MRRHAKASSAAPTASTGTIRTRKSLFGMACACVLGLVAFAGSGAPAAGAADGPCPNEQFRTGPGALLPDCRAYEQVSPVDKNGGDIRGANDQVSGTIAEDGSGATFQALTEFGGASSGGAPIPSDYLALRRGGNWQTASVAPRPEPAAAGALLLLSSSDLGRSMLSSTGVLAAEPPALDGQVNVYMRENGPGVVTPFLDVQVELNQFHSLVASPDMEHVVFVSGDVLTADPGVSPSESTSKVYEKVGDQPFRLVSVLPDGTPVPGEAVPGSALTHPISPSSTVGAVSEDGRHVFFTDRSSGLGKIYRRSDGTTTVFVSPSKRTPADPEGERSKQFQFATPDGNRVFFTSAELLTDDANTGPGPSRPGNDLYRYDVDDEELVDVSATEGGNGAEVLGVVGFDDRGERVYYTAKGAVVPGDGPGGEPDPTPGEANLYLWEDDGTTTGLTRFIAALAPPTGDPFFPETYDPGDSSNWHRLDGSWTARTSSDGAELVFQSKAVIPGGEEGGLTQIYHYDAEANAGTGQLDCVSCNPEGETPVGPSMILGHINRELAQRWELPRNLASDGRVFFTSQDVLLPGDTNGKLDAYAWKDGELDLLSTGTSSRDSYFYGASADGKDAFIVTDDALVPQDGDDLMDVYTAHVNGGIAAQFATPPPGCSGEECRNAGTQAPAGQGPLTPSFQGPGNTIRKPTKGRCPKGKRRVKTRNGNTRCVKKRSAQRKGKQNRANNDRRASR